MYDKSKPIYNQILKDSGFKQSLNFDFKTKVVPGKRHRKRKIIYYNPPFDISAKQNLGKLFFELINKYFPVQHPFSKIFNNNSYKLSYCCLTNMKQIIQPHNRKLLRNNSTVDDCKCLKKNKHKCPLPDKCNTENVIYKATVTYSCIKTYIGSTGRSFKKRWYGHCFSFRIENSKCIPCKSIRESASSSSSNNSSNSNLFCNHDTHTQYLTTLAEYVWKLIL